MNRVQSRHRSKSWGVRFEALDALVLSDEGRNRLDILGGNALDRRHVARVPVVLLHSPRHGEQESAIGMVVGFIEDREVRGPLSGTAEVGAMAFGAIQCVEVSASLDQTLILGRDGSFRAYNART